MKGDSKKNKNPSKSSSNDLKPRHSFGKILPKLAEKPVVNTQNDVEIQTHPPNLPLKPYLDNIWDVLHGYTGSIGDIETDITDIQTDITDIESDILDIQTNCCSGGGGSPNLDGGHPDSIYTAQVVDGGTP